MISRSACRGFSLLEVMVAFTILAMLLGALFRVFNAGMHAASAGDRYTRATVIAQSKLASLGPESPIVEGVSSGNTVDDFHWRISIGPYTDEQMQMTSPALQPLTVNVEVFWEDSGTPRIVSLTSMLLGSARP